MQYKNTPNLKVGVQIKKFQTVFLAVRDGSSRGPSLSEDGCVWSLSGWAMCASEVAGGESAPPSLEFSCDVSADARSSGTWQQEEQTVMAV